MPKDLTVVLQDRPGELARLGETAGSAGVNIQGMCAFTGEGRGIIHVLVADAKASGARRALEDAGMGWPTSASWWSPPTTSTAPARRSPSLRSAGGDVAGERLEGVHVVLDVIVGVGDRQRPLLLDPRGHEDPVVHVVEPGQRR